MTTPTHDHGGDDRPELLDLSFGEGPAHRPVDERIAAGRRALLRQRLLTGVAGLAVVAVVGTTYAVGSGGNDAAGLDPAAAPTEVATPEPAPAPDDAVSCVVGSAVVTAVPGAEPGTSASTGGGTDPAPPPLPDPADPADPAGPPASVEPAEPAEPDWGLAWGGEGCDDVTLPDPGPIGTPVGAGTSGSAYTGKLADFDPDSPVDPSMLATLSPDGELITADGVTIRRTVDNPLDLTAPDHSVGVVLEVEGLTIWGLAALRTSDDGCGQWSFEQVPAKDADAKGIEEWLQGDGSPDGFAQTLGGCDGGGAGYSSGYAGATTAEPPVPTTEDTEAGVTTGSDNPGGVDDKTGKP